jgi:hypothetical protein
MTYNRNVSKGGLSGVELSSHFGGLICTASFLPANEPVSL